MDEHFGDSWVTVPNLITHALPERENAPMTEAHGDDVNHDSRVG
ncbi:hypothetical protein [Glaciihabitans sp. UYNi722]